MIRGKYIVIEGPEGVGKTTQVEKIAYHLRSVGIPVKILREPDSQNDVTARAIRRLTQSVQYPMNTKTEVLLYNAARSQSLEQIEKSLVKGINCIVDRNYLTTLAVQYYGRGDVPDYEKINEVIKFAVGSNEPDLTIILDATVPVLKDRLKYRTQGERFDNLNEEFLERVRAGYLWEAKQRSIPVVFAHEDQDQVFAKIWSYVAQTLAQRKPEPENDKASSVAEIIATDKSLQSAPGGETKNETNEPFVIKNDDGNYTITQRGKDFLDQAVTNTDKNVYAFTNALSPITISAAMARLSRRGDDMRITLLDEFASSIGKDEKLLQRVITAYGDDSVQQLAGQHFVVEGASNLLTKKLEWGRLAAYLEQSTRYIFYDQKDSDGNYKYYLPPNIDRKTRLRYCDDINNIFSWYSELVQKLTRYVRENSSVPKSEQDGAWMAATRAQACDAARPMLPVSTKSTVGIFASGQALESLIMHLQSDSLLEAREVGEQILEETRKVVPVFLERADRPERGGAMIAYRANTFEQFDSLAKQSLPAEHPPTSEEVDLTDIWPRNELDLLPDMLYEHTNTSLSDLRRTVQNWPYEKKADLFKAYMGERLNRRHRPGRALEKVHYGWDLICDYGIFRDLQRHRMVDDLEWQTLSPRFGFDIPQLIEDAGLADLFEIAFDTSLELHSALLAGGYEIEAQYATLLGHKMRWKVMYNAREAFHLHELRTSPQGHPGYRKLVQQMHEKIAEIHPLIAEAMIFVNKDEDPELTRLAGERYTQFKLSQIDSSK